MTTNSISDIILEAVVSGTGIVTAVDCEIGCVEGHHGGNDGCSRGGLFVRDKRSNDLFGEAQGEKT